MRFFKHNSFLYVTTSKYRQKSDTMKSSGNFLIDGGKLRFHQIELIIQSNTALCNVGRSLIIWCSTTKQSPREPLRSSMINFQVVWSGVLLYFFFLFHLFLILISFISLFVPRFLSTVNWTTLQVCNVI